MRRYPGDRLLVGGVELEFCSVQFVGGCGPDLHATVRGLSAVRMALVVGDIVESSKIAEDTESQTLFRALDGCLPSYALSLRDTTAR
jgi:hypothetical protein